MDKEFSNIRIVDIAKMAGVSVGTVDRVIHNRGRVSEENRKKVQAILEMVNYQPNLMARSLASKKQYHFIAITPSFAQGEYWEAISEGIDKAASTMVFLPPSSWGTSSVGRYLISCICSSSLSGRSAFRRLIILLG